jgi:quercetin 2,3-dioxygenase
MMRIRRSADRGYFRNHWLEARFSFSFGHYRDPEYDGYSDLLVLNDDCVQPGQGFGPHSHADIEAISYPLAGEILGHVARMRPGDVQRMTAGRGITHSEMNASATAPEHHLQFWIAPSLRALRPEYEQRTFDESEKLGQLRLIVSPDGRDGSLTVHQDARIFASILRGDAVSYIPPRQRRTNGLDLAAGDGAAIEGEQRLILHPAPEGEVLLFDLR